MPLIKPPSNEAPIAYDEGPVEFKQEYYDFLLKRMDKTWKCSNCNCVNGGTNETCVKCKMRFGRITNRPLNYETTNPS